MNDSSKNSKPVCIYPKELQVLTNKSGRHARALAKVIKTYFNKEGHQVLTIQEACTYLGLTLEDANRMLEL